MFHAIEIISIVLVALAMAPALTHLLEFPGKKRLTKDARLTDQPIYYPGFTIAGGIGEVRGLVPVFVVLLLTQRGGPAFWLRPVALLAMLGLEIISWLYAQPVNKFWLHGTRLGSFGTVFFPVESGTRHLCCDEPEVFLACCCNSHPGLVG